MNEQKLLRLGIFGTVVAALCCFTPVLVLLSRVKEVEGGTLPLGGHQFVR